jgi:DNA repair protein RecO (recombination protein O)
MRRLRTPAIVLRRWAFGESSMTLRALTPELVSVSLMAKGVNKLTSGTLGVLDTWALIEMECGGSDDAELLTLYHASLLDRLSGLDGDPERLAAAAVLAEIAEDAAPPGQPAPELFLWLANALRALAALPPRADPAPVLVPALLSGLRLVGLDPTLEAAEGAGSEWFSPAAGGLVRETARPHAHARRLRPATLALLRSAASGAPLSPDGPWDDCLTILGEFLHYHWERPPRAWPLLQERRRRRARTA